MRSAAIFPPLLLITIACGPPGVGVQPTNEDSTSEDSTESTGVEPSTTETGEPPTTETSGGFTFVPDDDNPQVNECDMFEQDCPEGEKCVPYGSTGGSWDANKCVPILGDRAPGEPCTYGGVFHATDDCDATSHCWDVMDVDGELVGVCHVICTGTADAPECPPGSACLIASDSVIHLCIAGCDPVIQDCGPGLACFWANGDFNCIFTAQNIPIGEPCEFINDCAEGLGCVSAEVLPACADAACCTTFCELEAADPCEAQLPGTACVAFFDEGMAPPGYEHVGLCVLPP